MLSSEADGRTPSRDPDAAEGRETEIALGGGGSRSRMKMVTSAQEVSTCHARLKAVARRPLRRRTLTSCHNRRVQVERLRPTT